MELGAAVGKDSLPLKRLAWEWPRELDAPPMEDLETMLRPLLPAQLERSAEARMAAAREVSREIMCQGRVAGARARNFRRLRYLGEMTLWDKRKNPVLEEKCG